jgi:hypothetical protein
MRAELEKLGIEYRGPTVCQERKSGSAAHVLDAEHLDLLEKVLHHRLDQGVAAAMQHQLWFAAQEARSIDAQREIAPNPSRA